MIGLSKKYQLFALVLLLATLHSSCQKEQIAPFKQDVAFIKYYGHIAEQTASDLKRTADGGYIMCGSTNSYNNEIERDIFVVKTDSLGNEVWSTALGRSAGTATSGDLMGKYIRYDEEGIRIVLLPDGSGYTIACNRTYVEYADGSSLDGIKRRTKVVLYTLEIGTGVNITDVSSVVSNPNVDNGVELEAFTTATEKVSDMKIDSAGFGGGGAWSYVLTGYTTRIASGKPPHTTNGALDLTDIFTIKTDQFFNSLWSPGVLAYGFAGEDYGASVQILPDGYLITGTIQEDYVLARGEFSPNLIAVKMKKVNGSPLNPQYYGDADYYMDGGYSVYDAANNRITIAGSVRDGGNNAHQGSMALLQIDESLIPQTPNTNNIFGFKFYQPTAPTTLPGVTINQFNAASIAQLPNDEGFVVSMTYEKTTAEDNIAVSKVDNLLDLGNGWTYFFGYEDPNATATFATKEVAGAIIPVTETIAGTNNVALTGYAFTGTFGTGTNSMMGLVKLNAGGTFAPE